MNIFERAAAMIDDDLLTENTEFAKDSVESILLKNTQKPEFYSDSNGKRSLIKLCILLKQYFDKPVQVMINDDEQGELSKVNGLADLTTRLCDGKQTVFMRTYASNVRLFLITFINAVLKKNRAEKCVNYDEVKQVLNDHFGEIIQNDNGKAAKAYGNDLATKVKQRVQSLKSIHQQTVATNAQFKAECPAANSGLKSASHGRFIFANTAEGTAKSCVIDTVNHLQKTLTESEIAKLYPLLQQPGELYEELDKIFEEVYGDLINNRKTITTKTTFNFKQDAVVAIDSKMIGDTSTDKDIGKSGFEAGITATPTCVIHFACLRDKSLGENENFYNELRVDDSIVVFSKSRILLNKHYKNANEIHYFFDITAKARQDDKVAAQMKSDCYYNFFGAYSLVGTGDVSDTGEHPLYTPESVKGHVTETPKYEVYAKYEPIDTLGTSDVMNEVMSISNVEKAELIEHAIATLRKAGYKVIEK